MSSIAAGTTSTTALVSTADTTGTLVFQTGASATTALTIGTGQQVAFTLGSAAAPPITFTGDTNTGIFSPAADTIAFSEGGVESMRIDSSGNLQLSTAGTKILNSSGRPILQQTGGVLQVIQTTKTDTFSTSTTGSWVNITGLSAAITPTSTSSKVLVMVQLSIGGGGNNYGRGYGVKRGATQLNLGTYGTGSPGSFSASTNFSGGDDGGIMNATFIFLDSPASTSSTTYQVESYADSRSVTGTFINRTKNGTDVGSYGSSTITLMEIAG